MRGVALNGKRWTMEQMRELRNMRRAGFSWEEISERCGHSPIACKAKLAVLGAVFIPPSEILSASEREIQAQEFLENREREACDSLLAALREHHPPRAGEIVCTDKGFRVIAGAAGKPYCLDADVRAVLPESGAMGRPVPVHASSSASCAQAW